MRYDAKSFPEDLKFKTTGDRQNFQGRYILRHAFDGEMKCDAADEYKREVNKRKEKEVKTLANLTGWETKYIRTKMGVSEDGDFFDLNDTPKENWWNRIWPEKDK